MCYLFLHTGVVARQKNVGWNPKRQIGTIGNSEEQFRTTKNKRGEEEEEEEEIILYIGNSPEILSKFPFLFCLRQYITGIPLFTLKIGSYEGISAPFLFWSIKISSNDCIHENSPLRCVFSERSISWLKVIK